MVKNIALLFPGQGSQSPGMGKNLYDNFSEAKAIFDQADEIIPGIKAKIFEGSDEDLRRTDVTQPAIFIASCAAYEVFKAKFPELKEKVAAVAGHSLGEYSALYAAEIFDFKSGLKFVEYRGQILMDACREVPGGMAAILGMDRDQLQNLCRDVQDGGEVCERVNFNCPGQIVCAGTVKGIASLVEKVSVIAGAKAIPLNVSGPFHSSLLGKQAKMMEERLHEATLKDAWADVYSNCDASPTKDAAKIRKNLVTQIDHAVLWEDSIRAMMEKGIDTFVEVGPGKVLTGLMRKIDRKKKALNIEDLDSLNKGVENLQTAEVKSS